MIDSVRIVIVIANVRYVIFITCCKLVCRICDQQVQGKIIFSASNTHISRKGFVFYFEQQAVDAEEDKPDCNEHRPETEDPQADTAHAVGFDVQKEIRIDERAGAEKVEHGRVKTVSGGMDEDENAVQQRKQHRKQRITDLDFFLFVKQQPVGNEQHGHKHMEGHAVDFEIEGRVAGGFVCNKEIEHHKGQQNGQHTDEFK